MIKKTTFKTVAIKKRGNSKEENKTIPILNSKDLQKLDRYCIDNLLITDTQLMEQAGYIKKYRLIFG